MDLRIAAEYKTDVLVIGGGAAGCRAALAATEHGAKVILANKGPIGKSGITLTAGGGIQAPFHPEDNVEIYFRDTVEHGYYLGDQNVAWALCRDSCDRVRDLERYGVQFKRKENGDYDLLQFPGHSKPRQVSLLGQGVAMMHALRKAVCAEPGIILMEDFPVLDLVTNSRGAVVGAIGLDMRREELVLVRSRATVIATGGYQQIWDITDCPADSTGDGIALAYRAGAKIVDMEMVLFYPSVVVWPPIAKGCLVHYEYTMPAILDGDILDRHGVPVLPKPTPVRDLSMLLMAEAINEGRGTEHGGLYWDVTCSPKGKEFAANILNAPQYTYLRKLGIDPLVQKIEVAPGAHYQLGGIHINKKCETNIQGLFASTEAAGNPEGANRLSGSGLVGTQVFGYLAGKNAALFACEVEDSYMEHGDIEPGLKEINDVLINRSGKVSCFEIKKEMKQVAMANVGISRESKKLKEAISIFRALAQKLQEVQVPKVGVFNQALVDVLQMKVMLELAEYVAGSALLREESRGHHFRTDFPKRDDKAWLRHTQVTLGDNGRPLYSTAPVDMSRIVYEKQ